MTSFECFRPYSLHPIMGSPSVFTRNAGAMRVEWEEQWVGPAQLKINWGAQQHHPIHWRQERKLKGPLELCQIGPQKRYEPSWEGAGCVLQSLGRGGDSPLCPLHHPQIHQVLQPTHWPQEVKDQGRPLKPLLCLSIWESLKISIWHWFFLMGLTHVTPELRGSLDHTPGTRARPRCQGRAHRSKADGWHEESKNP